MVNITHKPKTLRIAIAQAVVTVSSEATIKAILNNEIPKGNVFEMAKTAGLFAAKKTSEMIPDCHPLPVEFTQVGYRIEGLEIFVEVEVHTIYRTGVEVEAMHAASVVALTMYDMLKPVDKGIEINNIKLLSKRGGKTDYQKISKDILVGVIVCSDSISNKEKEDKSGEIIIDFLNKYESPIKNFTIIPDDVETIQQTVMKLIQDDGCEMIILTGGTGLSPKDVTPEAIKPLLDLEIPGITEAIRSHGQERTPYAMLSRSVAGYCGNTMILALPGSSNGVKESLEAVFPAIFHIFRVRRFFNHQE
jgi:molybdenum cofactor biosynthesis protein MoaC